MPVKKDASGQRSVQAEAEIPGTPEEVWQAIATGPGISSWFVPTEFEGGEQPTRLVMHFGPGSSMDSVASVTSWDAPRRFTAESSMGGGPGSPTVATEWTVEARAGGTCVVRVVHRWFASTDDWDDQFEGTEHGWVAFFRVLRLYLTHFRGQPCSGFQAMAFAAGTTATAWDELGSPLGLSGVAEQQRVTSPAGAPRLSGWVERIGLPEHPELLVRLDEPAPGLAHLIAVPMGGKTCLSVRVFLYGAGAAAVAPREEPAWQAFLAERFPPQA